MPIIPPVLLLVAGDPALPPVELVLVEATVVVVLVVCAALVPLSSSLQPNPALSAHAIMIQAALARISTSSTILHGRRDHRTSLS